MQRNDADQASPEFDSAPMTCAAVAKVVLVLFVMVTVAPVAAAIALGVGYLRRERASGGRRG